MDSAAAAGAEERAPAFGQAEINWDKYASFPIPFIRSFRFSFGGKFNFHASIDLLELLCDAISLLLVLCLGFYLVVDGVKDLGAAC